MDREAKLVEAAMAGNGAAFARLVESSIPMLYRISHRLCRNDALAEDCVQETLTTAYLGLRRYTPGTSISAFLAAIAAGKAATLVRSEIRLKVREQRAYRKATAPSAEETTRAFELAALISAEILRMPEKRRNAALLRLDAGLSYREVASALNTSENSARVMVSGALKQIRKCLAIAANEDQRRTGTQGANHE